MCAFNAARPRRLAAEDRYPRRALLGRVTERSPGLLRPDRQLRRPPYKAWPTLLLSSPPRQSSRTRRLPACSNKTAYSPRRIVRNCVDMSEKSRSTRSLTLDDVGRHQALLWAMTRDRRLAISRIRACRREAAEACSSGRGRITCAARAASQAEPGAAAGFTTRCRMDMWCGPARQGAGPAVADKTSTARASWGSAPAA
jgi:hypothetical protein